jgi:hypothetical protein
MFKGTDSAMSLEGVLLAIPRPDLDPAIVALVALATYGTGAIATRVLSAMRYRRFRKGIVGYLASTRTAWSIQGFVGLNIVTQRLGGGRGVAWIRMETFDGFAVEFTVEDGRNYRQELVGRMQWASLARALNRKKAWEGGSPEGADRSRTVEAPSQSEGWWTVLGVAPHASRKEISTAWRTLSKKAHPDTPTGSREAVLRLNQAKDEALRSIGVRL